MNISDLESVNKLVKVKQRCMDALDQLEEYAASMSNSEDRDPGGMFGYDLGYHAVIASYSDGSGVGADMTGCYVGRQLAASARDILEGQIARINDDLLKFGVNMG